MRLLFGSLFFIGLFFHSAWADEEIQSTSSWSTAFDSFHYEFKGRRPADGNIYGFEKVTLDLQMWTLKYSYSSDLSFSLMVTHVNNYAETNFFGVLYKDRAQGMGDTLLKATQLYFLSPQDLLILDGGLSVPTGDIDRKNASNTIYNYPYNMQLGSGTLDPFFSGVFLRTTAPHQVGVYGLMKLRTGRNSNGYRLGNEYQLGATYAYLVSSVFTPSIKLNYKYLQRIEGEDDTFGRNIFTEFYHNKRDFWDFTLQLPLAYKLNPQFKVRADLALPLWQGSKNVDNVQVDTRWYAQLGLSYEGF